MIMGDSSETASARRWENSRLRQKGPMAYLNPQGGGATLNGNNTEVHEGGASLRGGNTGVHETDTKQATTHHAHHVAAQEGNQTAPIGNGHQRGNNLNPARPEFVPKGQTRGHAARVSNNNVGMASDLIMMATQGKQSRGSLSSIKEGPAYGQHQKQPTAINVEQSNQFTQQDTTPLGQVDAMSALPTAPPTMVAFSNGLTQQNKQQEPEQPRIGGSLSTGQLAYTRANNSVDVLRGTHSSPLPGDLRNKRSPVSYERESSRIASSRRSSPGSTESSLGPFSIHSEPLGPKLMASPEYTNGNNQHHEIMEGVAQHQQQRASVAMVEQMHCNTGAMAQHQQQFGDIRQMAQYQQYPGNIGDMAQYHHRPGGIIPQMPCVGPIPMGPVSDDVKTQRSFQLNQLTGETGVPTIKDMLDPNNIPFMELGAMCQPNTTHGVVVITNAPFNVTQAEVKAFMGRSSRILNDVDEPVHIMMDRVTSKTYDVYVEFMTLQDAVNAVNRHEDSVLRGRQPRLGYRHVDVKLSSQGDLMKQLFPFAKGVNWHQVPPGVQLNSRWSWENFDGFVSEEEMNMMWKHVENPGRTPFASDCKERIYECMISTLKKLPWYMTSYITIKQRQSIYNTASCMIRHLEEKIHDDPHHDRLTPQLLDRLVCAAMRCPGFTVLQKDNIAFIVGLSEAKCLEFNLPRMATTWRHQWGLTMKPGVPQDVVEYYISIIREETNRTVGFMNMQRRCELQALMSETCDYWGYFWAELAYPKGAVFDNMTIAEATAREWNAIEQIFRRALEGGAVPPY